MCVRAVPWGQYLNGACPPHSFPVHRQVMRGEVSPRTAEAASRWENLDRFRRCDTPAPPKAAKSSSLLHTRCSSCSPTHRTCLHQPPDRPASPHLSSPQAFQALACASQLSYSSLQSPLGLPCVPALPLNACLSNPSRVSATQLQLAQDGHWSGDLQEMTSSSTTTRNRFFDSARARVKT